MIVKHKNVKSSVLSSVLSISGKLDNKVEQKVIEQVLKDTGGNEEKTIALLSQIVNDANNQYQTKDELTHDAIDFISSQLQLENLTEFDKEIYKEVFITNQYDINKTMKDIMEILSISPTEIPTTSTPSQCFNLDSILETLTSGEFLHDSDQNNTELSSDLILKDIYQQIFGDLNESQFMIQTIILKEFDEFRMYKREQSPDSHLQTSPSSTSTALKLSKSTSNSRMSSLNEYSLHNETSSYSSSSQSTQAVAYKLVRELFSIDEISNVVIEDILYRYNFDVEATIEHLCQNINEYMSRSRNNNQSYSYVDMVKSQKTRCSNIDTTNFKEKTHRSIIPANMFQMTDRSKSPDEYFQDVQFSNDKNPIMSSIPQSTTTTKSNNNNSDSSSDQENNKHDINKWTEVRHRNKPYHIDTSSSPSLSTKTVVESRNDDNHANNDTTTNINNMNDDELYWRHIADEQVTQMIHYFTQAKSIATSSSLGLRCRGHSYGSSLASHFAELGQQAKLGFSYAEKMCTLYTLQRYNPYIRLLYDDNNNNHNNSSCNSHSNKDNSSSSDNNHIVITGSGAQVTRNIYDSAVTDDSCSIVEFHGYSDGPYADTNLIHNLQQNKRNHKSVSNTNTSAHSSIDLHGLNVRQSLRIIKSVIVYYRSLIRSYTNNIATNNNNSNSSTAATKTKNKNKSSSTNNANMSQNDDAMKLLVVRLIVGRGSHSHQGISRLKPSIITYLTRQNIQYHIEAGAGEISMYLP